MKLHLKPLGKKTLAAAIFGLTVFGTCNDLPKHDTHKNVPIVEEISKTQAAALTILACKNFNDLKTHFPDFFANFEKITKEPKALLELYKAIHSHMIKLMNETRMGEKDKSYIDDLAFLGSLFEEQTTKNGRMAVVFLSLPRLIERAIIIDWGGDPLEYNMLEYFKLHAESGLFNALEDYGLGDLAKALRTYWYKKDGSPTEEEGEEFFKIFSRLY